MKALSLAAVLLGIGGGWLSRSRDRVVSRYGQTVIACALIFALIALTGCASASGPMLVEKPKGTPGWATSLAVAGPLMDGASTVYAINQSGPKARIAEGNGFYYRLFGSNVRPGEIFAFKVGQSVLMGAIVHAAGKEHRGLAIGAAVIQFAVNAWATSQNMRNAGIVRRLNR